MYRSFMLVQKIVINKYCQISYSAISDNKIQLPDQISILWLIVDRLFHNYDDNYLKRSFS